MERAKRFGMVIPEVEEEKKKRRAEKFGMIIPEVEEEKKKLRAEKFGIPLISGDMFLKDKKVKID